MNEPASISPQSQAVANSTLPLQALIFDMDGVLCDTMPYHLDAWLQYSATIPELAVASRDRLEQMGGKRNEDLLPELLGHPVSDADIQRWGSEKEAVYRSLIKDEIQWMPGLISFLQQAQAAGLKLGLGTSACRENVDLLMEQDQLGGFFAAQVIETDVERGKPDPQCYLLVAERLGVSPDQCLVFEDAIAGTQAARNAGMRCWGVLTTHSAAELKQAGAEYCIQDFTDPALLQLFGQ
ncbi:HAD family phosphatase [Acaryochloris sp. 'Moss Beach']|uniref:HAD family hydrolase n=1 Tax=Acaryochloris sp. 'Moss Beach' TaxID=2740837 RepID=UPI001F23E335|nr:HAD family phosphatase [Acaryochloris sp. 'Moss Beach']UJB69172.1 HAD family phosphatase [Acaryochloris sp. 'Moss Beach']